MNDTYATNRNEEATNKQLWFLADLFGQLWLSKAKEDKSNFRWQAKKILGGAMQKFYKGEESVRTEPLTKGDVERFVELHKQGNLEIPKDLEAMITIDVNELSEDRKKPKKTAKARKSVAASKVDVKQIQNDTAEQVANQLAPFLKELTTTVTKLEKRLHQVELRNQMEDEINH